MIETENVIVGEINAQQIIGEINVGGESFTLQEKSTTPTNEAQEIVADENYDGLSKVNVGAIPSEYIVPTGTLDITSNDTYDVKNYASANVNVPTPTPNLQEKSITATYNNLFTSTEVTADSGYDGLSKVNITNDTYAPIYYKLTFNNGQELTNNLRNIKLKNVVFYGKEYDEMFYMCTEVETIELTEAQSQGAYLNFKHCENMNYMFENCASLTTITNLDKINVSSLKLFDDMFNGCSNLDDETLNNIMLMCSRINMNIYQGGTYFGAIGLTFNQIRRCHNLSNYQAAIDNGWTDD